MVERRRIFTETVRRLLPQRQRHGKATPERQAYWEMLAGIPLHQAHDLQKRYEATADDVNRSDELSQHLYGIVEGLRAARSAPEGIAAPESFLLEEVAIIRRELPLIERLRAPAMDTDRSRYEYEALRAALRSLDPDDPRKLNVRIDLVEQTFVAAAQDLDTRYRDSDKMLFGQQRVSLTDLLEELRVICDEAVSLTNGEQESPFVDLRDELWQLEYTRTDAQSRARYFDPRGDHWYDCLFGVNRPDLRPFRANDIDGVIIDVGALFAGASHSDSDTSDLLATHPGLGAREFLTTLQLLGAPIAVLTFLSQDALENVFRLTNLPTENTIAIRAEPEDVASRWHDAGHQGTRPLFIGSPENAQRFAALGSERPIAVGVHPRSKATGNGPVVPLVPHLPYLGIEGGRFGISPFEPQESAIRVYSRNLGALLDTVTQARDLGGAGPIVPGSPPQHHPATAFDFL
jgi:hypothetical protein